MGIAIIIVDAERLSMEKLEYLFPRLRQWVEDHVEYAIDNDKTIKVIRPGFKDPGL